MKSKKRVRNSKTVPSDEVEMLYRGILDAALDGVITMGARTRPRVYRRAIPLPALLVPAENFCRRPHRKSRRARLIPKPARGDLRPF